VLLTNPIVYQPILWVIQGLILKDS
jgi:hypothetical protein